jgi:hypothetical protein
MIMSGWRVIYTGRNGEELSSEGAFANFDDAVFFSHFVLNYPERHSVVAIDGRRVPAVEIDFAIDERYVEIAETTAA